MTSSQLPSQYTGPGLIDLQVNGYAGMSFHLPAAEWDLDKLHEMRGRLNRRGVAVILPTLITDDPKGLTDQAAGYRKVVEADPELAAMMPRLHVEGPFISPVDGPRGAHPKCHAKPPVALPELFDRLLDASGGRIGIWTLAPELPGACELIRRLREAGVVASLGHCQPSNDAIRAAVDAGAIMSTHLGNGSHQMLPRLDNYVQTQLAEDRLHASFIADGHHMPFTTLKNFIRAKTPPRSVLVTDAIAAAEMRPGIYELGGEEVEVSPEGRCRHPGAPNLAGSVLTLDKAVINTATHADVTFEQAWAMASTQPAALIGIDPPADVTVEITAEGFVTK